MSAPAFLESSMAIDRDELALAGQRALRMEHVACCICEDDHSEPLAVGEDFEYHTSADTFLAIRCLDCGLVYLNPRPAEIELGTIYPPTYHAFNFSEERFGFIFKVRRRLEARRLLSWCKDLPDDARVIDIGCGDGFHLQLLSEFGSDGWHLEGVDNSEAAIDVAVKRGLTVHLGKLEQLNLRAKSYDMAILVQTIEHVDNPVKVLSSIRRILKPGGRLIIVTDNTGSLDFRLFNGRHWGGYHFPRHWNLFNSNALRRAAQKAGFEVSTLATAVSPVNWVYSIRNFLVDFNAPGWLINRFSLESPVSLGLFTVFDTLNALLGKGALLHGVLRRPAD